MKTSNYVLAGMVVLSLLLSACGGKSAVQQVAASEGKKQVATFNYQKVAASHPKEKVIRYEAGMLQDFKDRRAEQVVIARKSFASIRNLQYMQQLSKLGYLEAEAQTRMAELKNVEKEKLTFMEAKWLKEANAKIEERKSAIEEEYRLELFNLRVKAENTRLKPEEQEAIHKQVVATKREREARLAALFKERDAYIAEQAKPYLEGMGVRIAEKNSQLSDRNLKATEGIEKQYDERMADAPQALARAMQLLDEEISRLERRQEEMTEQVGKDVLEVAKKVAAKHGCELSLVSKENSLDITEEVLNEVKLTK